MPLRAAERMRKYRQKIKEDGQKDIKQLAKDRKRKSEAKENMTTEQLAQHRQRNKVSVQKHRNMGKPVLTECETPENSNRPAASYSRQSSLTRALPKTMDSLPQCAVKRQLIISKLLEQHPNVKTRSSKPVHTDLVAAVKEFYMRDDITYQVNNITHYKFRKFFVGKTCW